MTCHGTMGMGLAMHGCALLLCGVVVSACDAVGKPLVDVYVPVHEGVGPDLCRQPLHCEGADTYLLPFSDTEPNDIPKPTSIAPIDLQRCIGSGRSCDDSAEPAADESGVPVQSNACKQSWKAGHPLMPATFYERLTCQELRIEPLDPDREAKTKLDNAVWHNVVVVIESTLPFRVQLDFADLRGVSFELKGPVTLALTHTRLATSISVQSDDTAARVEIEAIEAETVKVGDDRRAFAGEVSITRSRIEHSQFYTPSLTLQSAELDLTFVEADTLMMTDGLIHRAKIGTDQAQLVGSRFDQVEFTHCNALTLLVVRAIHVRIPACDDQLVRVYASSIQAGLLDGRFESDTTRFMDSIFGATADTDLTAWGGEFANINFCKFASNARFNMSAFSCTVCEEGLAGDDAICDITDEDRPFRGPCRYDRYPPDEPAPCPKPLPVRTRPSMPGARPPLF